MSTALYTSCADVFSLCQAVQDDLNAILHRDNGFAPRLRQICRKQLEELMSGQADPEEVEMLQLEENIWALLQAVMAARKTEPQTAPVTPHDLLRNNPFTPTSTLAQAVMQSSRLLTELIVIREWLQDTAPPVQNPGATTGYLPATRHNASLAKLISGRPGTNSAALVKELDPDVLNREDGSHYMADDASYEKSVSQALYGYLRAGRMDDAFDLCNKANQPWRAASIRGSLLFRWKAISNDDMDDDDYDELPTGNPNRRLWKSTCLRAALNPSLPSHERVLYAALAPSPQTSVILKSACRTWEDHLWAQISIVIEEKESTEMGKLGGFWEGGQNVTMAADDEEAEEEEWENEVIGALEGLESVGVTEGPSAIHPFHRTELSIILDRTSAMVEQYAAMLVEMQGEEGQPPYTTHTRFFAHLCLFMQMLGDPVPPEAMHVILEAYLRVLQDADQKELIALYAAALGKNAVERYATFLVSLELTGDREERKNQLSRANEHGLDVHTVALRTAELSVTKAFTILPAANGPLPRGGAMQPSASQEELFLLRSIEWMTLVDSLYPEALNQANVIVRYFLACGRTELALKFFRSLPSILSSTTDDHYDALEFTHYGQFFKIWEQLQRVVDSQAMDTPGMVRDTRKAWVREYSALLQETGGLIEKLLTCDWLLASGTEEDSSPRSRRKEYFVRIRQIYIPELIIRLHFFLINSRSHIPQNLKRALELVNIVADSRYRLYDDFSDSDGKRLSDYLGAVREAVLAGLENGGSDPFRIVT